MIDLCCGDCLEVIKTLPDNSVDAIVTDPPYELGFMGKHWDASGIAYNVEVWLDCLRVLKPGGHLLAFGGSRTYHRLACAVEDAGFEIRDQIQWVYAQGFPKSLDIGKAIDKAAGAEREVVGRNSNDRVRRGNTLADYGLQGGVGNGVLTAPATPAAQEWDGWGTALKPAHEPIVVARKPFDSVKLSEIYAATGWDWYCSLTSCYAGSRAFEKFVERGFAPIEESREEIAERVAATLEGCPGDEEFDAELEKRLTKIKPKRFFRTETKLALHPGVETQKSVEHAAGVTVYETSPFRDGTKQSVAVNVLKWGTGAINVDGCRVGYESEKDKYSNGFCKAPVNGRQFADGSSGFTSGRIHEPKEGRWPANLIHDGSDEVVRLFPVTSSGGIITPKTNDIRENKDYKTNTYNGGWGANKTTRGWNDTGPAARFFYCAKASKRDRDEGCEGMEERESQSTGWSGDGMPLRQDGTERKMPLARNHHPTVKPTALMQYLCRLITPPGGVVLDPFMGSGSTGKAAVKEGFKFIGIEKDLEYFAIAEARINHAIRQREESLV